MDLIHNWYVCVLKPICNKPTYLTIHVSIPSIGTKTMASWHEPLYTRSNMLMSHCVKSDYDLYYISIQGQTGNESWHVGNSVRFQNQNDRNYQKPVYGTAVMKQHDM